nr:bifunctional diaminohydroxyphosphoribosylaminopyrimidine deaminase/5-amino-6-(5-phosphoribosylamino)uracil reductase RibD [Rhodoferax sp.]
MLEVSHCRPIETALQLAEKGIFLTAPNPRVGCVLATADGRVIGEGHTQQAGGPHAEIMALRDAQARGASTQGATAWVTLEPCTHHGRTGPCCDALIAAGIGKVVASIADPNPLVSGQGFARLRAAGIEVEVGPGAHESRELNIGFFSRMVRRVPWVRMKLAASLDGKTALDNGVSQWITSEPARADGHAWRARACAVLTGIGTVLDDDPRLDVRLMDTSRQPHLAVVDSRLETPHDARLFEAQRRVFIYAAVDHPERRA